jgi:MOSC domain-containing protein YiiM
MRELEAAKAVKDRGFDGCIHGRPGSKRQILIMDLETLQNLELEPGTLKENITTCGLKVPDLREGHRVRAGEALLEVTGPCHPCHLMDEIRPGLQEALRGRRGILCRVVEGGTVRPGDRIELLDYAQVAS